MADKRNSRGRQEFPDGRVYDGEWKDGKFHGKGKMIWPVGQVYEGEWKNGLRDGRGKNMWSDGEVYEGEYKEDKKNGEGKNSWPDGRVYDGQWKDGKSNGRGKMTSPSGQVYDGEWNDDKANGKGNMTRSDGQVYDGEWKEGKFHGIGTLISPDGQVQEGVWENNTLIQSLQNVPLPAPVTEEPPDFFCDMTFTYRLMRDPVVAADGFTYERFDIEKWFQTHNTSPRTGAQIAHTILIPNNSLRSAIGDWISQHPHYNGGGNVSRTKYLTKTKNGRIKRVSKKQRINRRTSLRK